MKKSVKYSLSSFLAFIVLCGSFYFLFPGWVVKGTIYSKAFLSGLNEKETKAGAHQWFYYEGGEKNSEALIFIHGYGANKSHWIENMKILKEKYHVFAPDMPGFGKNKALDALNYDIDSYTQYLNEFIEALQIKRFHLAGISMGGLIAGYYASVYPQKVISLTLTDSAGVISETLSEYQKHYLATGENLLAYKTVEGFDKMMNLVFFKPPKFPSHIKKYLVEEKIKRLETEEKIFNQMIQSGVNLLGDHLSGIQAKTLIIWGENDKIIDVSTAQIIKSKLKNAELYIIKESGHTPNVEKAKEVNQILLDFLGRIK